MPSPISISHVVTVYTKRDYLPATVASLLGQDCPYPREFIFVDDNSTDDSVAVLEACTRGVPDVHVIRNTTNQGPSVRLNQGARLASGEYLHFLDHDDIVPRNAVRIMHQTLAQTGADFTYGRWEKTGLPAAELLSHTIAEHPPFSLSDHPLETILNDRFIRMCCMVSREVFLASGGCDERIFIQDESLPLRLAAASRKFAALEALVNLVPAVQGNLSDNKSQLNHDRFLAYAHMLEDFPGLPPHLRAKLYARAVSAAWKQARKMPRTHWFYAVLPHYLRSKWSPVAPDPAALARMHRFFGGIPGVRRM